MPFQPHAAETHPAPRSFRGSRAGVNAVFVGLAVSLACAGGDKPDIEASQRDDTPAGLVAAWTESATPAFQARQRALWSLGSAADGGAVDAALKAEADWSVATRTPKLLQRTRELFRKSEVTGVAITSDPVTAASIVQIRRLARLPGGGDREAVARAEGRLQRALRSLPTPATGGSDPSLSAAEEGAPRHPATAYASAKELDARAAAWEALQEPTSRARAPFLDRRDALVAAAQKGGWDSPLSAALAPLDPTTDPTPALAAWAADVADATFPLFRELHTWARHTLAARYGQPVPDKLPAHWLPDPLGTSWEGLADDPFGSREVAPDLRAMADGALAWTQGAGFAPLPSGLLDEARLTPLPPGAPPQGATMVLGAARSLRLHIAASPDVRGLGVALTELGHAHALDARATASRPRPLRVEPPHGLQGAVAVATAVAGTRPQRLASAGVLAPAELPDAEAQALRDALVLLPALRALAGPIHILERELYTGTLDVNRLNGRSWQLLEAWLGVVPPAPRGERHADLIAHPALRDAPAQALDRLVAMVVGLQLYAHAADSIGTGPLSADLTGHAELGGGARALALAEGVTPWQAAAEHATAAPPSVDAVLAWLEPARRWLATQNQGRAHTLLPPSAAR